MDVNRMLCTAMACLLLMASGCGGGGSSSSPPPPPPPPPPPVVITTPEAFVFLNQATFGATLANAQRLIDLGYEGWVDEQLAQPASLKLPHLQSLPVPTQPQTLQTDRVDIWFRNVINGDDQLRQRVAFALSEIMVVSQLGALNRSPYALADYYDVLVRGAFGNYRDLLEEVTLHPAMGVYLSMLGNRKPDTANNIRPDENYAREVMQLFSIGLVQLNSDGSDQLDDGGLPIPTYDQATIEGFAHVFTGWHWADAPNGFLSARPSLENQIKPMQLYPDFHDDGVKLLLNGEMIAANQGGVADLDQALDNLFNHPNVAPFISYRLIQRLVSSNPSAAYIGRMSSVFNDNGQGERGDLGALVKAILLDPEARALTRTDTGGKLKEPLLRLTQLYRAYDAQSQSGRYPLVFAYVALGQGVLQSPSVFNFFSPFYAPPGEIQDQGLVAPELQIATEYQNTFLTNTLFDQTFVNQSENLANLGEDDVYLDIAAEVAIADDIDGLVALVADKLMAGEISPTLDAQVKQMLGRTQPTDTALRAAETIYLIASSPEYALQR
ncbi:MAG: DUF1800 domain-containing protein [Pseudomonadota bacterium]